MRSSGCCRLLFVPGGHGVQHAEDRERTDARVEVRPKFAAFHPRAQHVFKYALDRPGMAANPMPTFGWQMAPFVQEHFHVVTPVPQRVEMRGDEGARACLYGVPGASVTLIAASTKPSTPRAHTISSATSLDGK